ncbi:hypothetical protein D020_1364B, partial [Vibrio parahaemolyticus SBR10290]
PLLIAACGNEFGLFAL